MTISKLPILIGAKTLLDLLEQVESFSKAEAAAVLEKLRQNLREAEKSGDKLQTGWTLLYVAMILRGQRQYQSAFKLLEKALRIFELEEHAVGMGWIYQELAIASRESDRNALALDHAHKALRYFQEAGATNALAWVYDNLARIHMNQFNRHEALTFAKKARALFIEFQSKPGMAWNACNLGGVYVELGSFENAEKFFTEALNTFGQIGNKQGEAWSLLGLSVSSRRQSKYEKAREYLGRSKFIYRQLGLKDRVAWCMLSEAAIDRLTGEVADAIQINKQAVQNFSHLRNRDGVAWGLFQLGQIYRDQGRLIKAWQTFRESHNLHTDIANREGMGWSDNDWGETYIELNDLSHARECFIKAKVIAEQIDAVPLKIEVDDNLAGMYLEEGFLQRAMATTKESEEVARKIQANELIVKILMGKSRQQVLLNEIEKAKTAIDEARFIADSHSLRLYSPKLAIHAAEIRILENKPEEGIKMLTEALEKATEFQQRRVRVEAFFGLIQLWRLNKTPLKKIQPVVFQLDKDLKAIGSRKLKAKYLAVKTLVEYAYKKKLDPKTLGECVRVMESAGLVVLEYQLLKFFEDIYKKKGMEPELKECREKLKEILERNPIDLYLIQPRLEDTSPLPISLIL